MPAELLGEAANQFPGPGPQQGTIPQNQVVQSQPSNPAGTASATFVMMGLAVLFTPKKTGRIKITAQMLMGNSTTADGSTVIISTGTGSAPVNGAASTGNAAGLAQTWTSLTGVLNVGVLIVALVTGLVVGTQIWVDLQLKAVTGGTSTLLAINLVIEEV